MKALPLTLCLAASALAISCRTKEPSFGIPDPKPSLKERVFSDDRADRWAKKRDEWSRREDERAQRMFDRMKSDNYR